MQKLGKIGTMTLNVPKKTVFKISEKHRDADQPLRNEDLYIQVYPKNCKLHNIKITVEYEKEIQL